MTDQPLDQSTLEALQRVLWANDPPAVDPETWHGMLRRSFQSDERLFGDSSAEDLLPPDWPAQGDAEGTGPAGAEETTWTSGEDEWPVDGDPWSGLDPDDDGSTWPDNADNPYSDGGDL